VRQPTHQSQFARVTKITATVMIAMVVRSETRLVDVSGVDFDSAFKPDWGIFSSCRIHALLGTGVVNSPTSCQNV